MRRLPMVLLNAGVVLAAILVYDALRGDDPAPLSPPDPNAALRGRIDSLEARMAAIESSRPAPLPRGTDAGLVERVGDLERRIRDASPVAEPPPPGTPPSDAEDADLSPEAIEKFRKLAAAARDEERARRIGLHVDETLEELGITLTGDQREKLVTAFGAFEPRRAEIWGGAKARGIEAGARVNWDLIVAETNRLIAREFADTISGFLSYGDATAISEGLGTPRK